MPLRALVADDSIVFRKVMSDVLRAQPGVEVVGTAANGRLAVQRVRELRPDLLTLDIEMPEMDGLAVLDALREAGEDVSVIVVSALTRRGGQLTMKALQRGAFDFITKPEGSDPDASRKALALDLAPRLRALANRREVRDILRGTPAPAARQAPPPLAKRTSEPPEPARPRYPVAGKPDFVLVGVSTGGPNALAALLPGLPGDLGVPVLVVQHMPPLFTQSLAESLSAKCALRVKEAADGDIAQPGTVYIAPGGMQMRLASGGVLHVRDDPPENNCKPSVDYLFRSAANAFPGRAMAVILTGMGSDGTLGLRLLKRHGCHALAQNEASCVVYGMPKAAVEAGVVDKVLPLDQMAAEIVRIVRGRLA
jgi:two-component system, chemotaxis family, protein-glutamate methylesterase/glutaminase